jgi:hypothetical protein
MESKITSTDPRRRPARAGVTLVEFVISMGITAIVALALVAISMTTGRSLSEMFNYIDLDHYNRIALDTMTRDLRQVRYLSSYQTNAVSFMDQYSNTLSFVYSPTNRLLTRVSGGKTNTLLRDCDFLRFGIYQRTPQSNSWNLYTASELTNCKVVSVSWSCSRSMFGLKANTEQGQTARIIIRNKKEENTPDAVLKIINASGSKGANE